MINQYFTHTQRPATILIVDDEPANIHVLSTILKTDAQIIFSLSGENALRIAELRTPDLIILDVKMPTLDGFAVCAKLKEHHTLKDIPVIFITAMSEAHDEIKGLEVGGIDYITKPINPTIVRSRIRNHLELKAQRDLLRHFSASDTLTGIANRRSFDEALRREWRRALRNQTPLSLIVADLDYFQNYNHRYGHQAGDECLRIVADIFYHLLQHHGDLVARYGGAELICLLPETNADHAEQLASTIITALAHHAIPHEASPIASIVTLSAGVVTILPNTTFDLDENNLLACADDLLQQAKKQGRNQYCAKIVHNNIIIHHAPEDQTELNLARQRTNHHFDITAPSSEILIVDNDATHSAMLAHLLQRDYAILLARSGKAALQIIAQHRPNLILLDFNIEDSNECLMSNTCKDIPMIFMTAMNDVDAKLKELEIDTIDYITKPIQPMILINRVRNHLKLKMQRDILHRASIIDGLTKITNRRGFDKSLEHEWYRAMNNNLPISLIMADIDYFKSYNDRYGDQQGDECLRIIAQVLQKYMRRPADLAARYGGEEFVCLLPDTDSLGAQSVARAIMADITALAIPYENSPLVPMLTISMGVATVNPGITDSQHDLLALVDNCLYEAKKAGKNQIKFQV